MAHTYRNQNRSHAVLMCTMPSWCVPQHQNHRNKGVNPESSVKGN